MPNLTPEQATRYAIHLQRANSHQLGFLTKQAITEYAERGHLELTMENGQPCGYLLYRLPKPNTDPKLTWTTARIIQTCVEYDLRRIHHATSMINHILTKAQNLHVGTLSLWCAADLDANRFWITLGFKWTHMRRGGTRRKRIHYGYTLDIRYQDRVDPDPNKLRTINWHPATQIPH